MRFNPIKPNPVSFKCYNHPLKALFKKGRLPGVTRGIYGKRLTRWNISIEHLVPKSLGGTLDLRNIALADRDMNAARGNRPLANFLSWEQLEYYLQQFNFKIAGIFDGFKYQELVRETCMKLGIEPPADIAEKIAKHSTPKKILRSMRNKAKKGLDVIV